MITREEQLLYDKSVSRASDAYHHPHGFYALDVIINLIKERDHIRNIARWGMELPGLPRILQVLHVLGIPGSCTWQKASGMSLDVWTRDNEGGQG